MKKKIIVVGGGAAGMLAAIRAAESGADVTVLEKMERMGKKLSITGKGRCNITNSAGAQEFVKNMTGNGPFLYSAFHQFDNHAVVAFFHALGVATKLERGGRVFPVSDRAADVVDALQNRMYELGVNICTRCPVSELAADGEKICGVKTVDGAFYEADAVIVAVGGASYPATGSSGDGAELAAAVGHSIVPLKPSLVPLETEEDWVQAAQGLSLRNVRAELFLGDRKIGSEFGEMIFTHFGVSGPIILSLSRQASVALARKSGEVVLTIDVKPALSLETLDRRIQRDFSKFRRKQVKNGLHELLPSSLIDIALDLSYIDGEKMTGSVTRAERLQLARTLKRLELTVTKTRGVAEAIVTAGGVETKEIQPKTMESKLVCGLYFAGEVIDVDGFTGGFNLQAAFSTGHAAGVHAALAE